MTHLLSSHDDVTTSCLASTETKTGMRELGLDEINQVSGGWWAGIAIGFVKTSAGFLWDHRREINESFLEMNRVNSQLDPW